MKLIVLSLLVFLYACSSVNNQENGKTHDLKVEQITGSDYWGFTIEQDGKTIIKQSIIPAFSGNQHFFDSTSARAVGQLMMEKLDSGIFPPALSKSEIIGVWPMNALLPED